MKDIIVELIKFIKESPLSKVLLLLLFVPGLAGIVFAVSNNLAAWAGVGTAWRAVVFITGVIFMAVGVGQTIVQFSFNRLKSWLTQQFVTTAITDIETKTATLVTAACTRLDEHSATLLEKATDTLLEEKTQLQLAQVQLVNKVEDATRRVLEGIPQIFERAYRLIRQADREIWWVNFTFEFGKVHCENESVRRKYSEMFGRDFQDDVTDFYDVLEEKAKRIRVVNMLTISQNSAYEKFMQPLLVRPGYDSLSQIVTDPAILNGRLSEPKFQLLLNDMASAQKKFSEETKNEERQGRFKGAGQYRSRHLTTLPIQLLIAGIAGKNGERTDKYGCVVFMLGSDNIRTTETGKEVGIYTELPDLVLVMKNLALSLMPRSSSKSEVVELAPQLSSRN